MSTRSPSASGVLMKDTPSLRTTTPRPATGGQVAGLTSGPGGKLACAGKRQQRQGGLVDRDGEGSTAAGSLPLIERGDDAGCRAGGRPDIRHEHRRDFDDSGGPYPPDTLRG